MQELLIEGDEVVKIAKALSSKTRWRIITLLRDKKKTDISRIAEALKQTEANISAQIKILEKAGIVKTHYEPGEHGVRKICELQLDRIVIKLR
ncbi:MAG: ArsR/SmtB family transcription factor [Candidatus Baldrarchaeia archaeon]